MRKPDGPTLFLGAALLVALATFGGLFLHSFRGSLTTEAATEAVTPETAALETAATATRRPLADLPFDGRRSYGYLNQLCALGPRFSGSPGMVKQQELLEKHFRDQGAKVDRQQFRVRHPLSGAPVDMANLIVQWHPDRRDRVLLCAHYDTRPFPDRDPDPRRRRGIFLGANDGASGVAVLMELGQRMPELKTSWGVDFVLFDGEELVYDDERNEYFLGSRYFAQKYVEQPPQHRYNAAVLLDMVGDKHLQLFQERISLSWADSRPLVESIWKKAETLGVREFIPRGRYEIRDDHLMLHDIAGIPACDLIDFDYVAPGSRRSFWHTEGDSPDKCSAESLAKVGWVVWEWLREGAEPFAVRRAAQEDAP